MNAHLRSRRWRSRAVLGAVLAGALALGTVTAGAAPPSEDPPLAAEFGARWLAGQVAADGSVTGGFDPLGDAGSAALALAAAGVESDAYERALDHVVANAATFVAPFGTDDAGRLGRALLLAEAAGIDPTSFGGVDLVSRLEATLGDFAPGLYGAGDPTYDGAFRQSLALLGLAAAGETPAAAAVDWLLDQQCDATTPAAQGGWESYRANLAVPCAAPDAVLFAGPDSNATGYAAMALDALGEAPDHDPLAYLASVQSADGGWSLYGAGAGDPNSTGIVIQALLAAGEDPATWGSPTPYESLLGWVIVCGEEDAGAFASPYSAGAPDVFASLDAVPAAAGVAWPLDGPVELAGTAPVPCEDEPTTTTTTADGTDPTSTTSTTSTTGPGGPRTAPPAAAQPVAAQFTG
jgi:hypothetical protein